MAGREAVVSALLQRIAPPSFARQHPTALDCVQHVLCHWSPGGSGQLTRVAISATLVAGVLETLLTAFIEASLAASNSDGFEAQLSATLLAVSARNGSVAEMAVTSVLRRVQAAEGTKSERAR